MGTRRLHLAEDIHKLRIDNNGALIGRGKDLVSDPKHKHIFPWHKEHVDNEQQGADPGKRSKHDLKGTLTGEAVLLATCPHFHRISVGCLVI